MSRSSVLYTSNDLVFDPTTHTSKLPDGRPVPHVTAVLSAVGVSTDFEALIEARGRRFERHVQYARALGEAVHKDTHAIDDGEFDWDTAHPDVLPYLHAWNQFKENLGLVPELHGRERHLYHPHFNYTGIQDGIFRQASGRKKKRIMIDIKTGDPDSSAAHLQTAAYEEAWNFENPRAKIDERWAVRLVPEMRVPYRPYNYTAHPESTYDFRKFVACLTVFQEQPERRKRRTT